MTTAAMTARKRGSFTRFFTGRGSRTVPRHSRSSVPPAAARRPADLESLLPAASPARTAMLAIDAAGRDDLTILVSYLAGLPVDDLIAVGKAGAKVASFSAAVARTRREMRVRADQLPVAPGMYHCLACLMGDGGACREPGCRCRHTWPAPSRDERPTQPDLEQVPAPGPVPAAAPVPELTGAAAGDLPADGGRPGDCE